MKDDLQRKQMTKVLIKQTKNQHVLTVVQDKSLLHCSAYIST